MHEPIIPAMTRLRNYFLTGLIVCAPLAITAYLAWSFIGWVDGWVKPYIPAALQSGQLSAVRGAGLRPAGRADHDHADRFPDRQFHRPGDRLLRRVRARPHAAGARHLQGAEADFRDRAVEQERDVQQGRAGRISAQGCLVAGLRRRRERHRDQCRARPSGRPADRRVHAVYAEPDHRLPDVCLPLRNRHARHDDRGRRQADRLGGLGRAGVQAQDDRRSTASRSRRR